MGTGRYVVGALSGQNPPAPGFNGAWSLGTGSTKFTAQSAGLTSSAVTYEAGGSVLMTGAPTDVGQSIARAVAVPASSTYYLSGLFNRGNSNTITAGAYALMGFGNAVLPTAVTSGSTLQGVYIGYAQTAATTSGGTLDDYGDLIIRTRQTIGGINRTVDTVLVDGQATSTYLQNYFVVAKLSVNASGTTDTLNYWVNPTSITSDATMTSTALLAGSVNVSTIASSTDLSQLTFAEANYDATISFDEPRIATNLTDLAAASPIPEPGVAAILGVGILLRRRKS